MAECGQVVGIARNAHYYGQSPNCFCNSSPHLSNYMVRADWFINQKEASSTCSGKTGGDGWFRTTQLRLDIAAQSCWDSAALFVATAQGYLGTWWVWDWKFIIYNKKFITVNLPHSKFYWNWWENPLVTLSVTTCCTWDKGMLRSLLLSSVFRWIINN